MLFFIHSQDKVVAFRTLNLDPIQSSDFQLMQILLKLLNIRVISFRWFLKQMSLHPLVAHELCHVVADSVWKYHNYFLAVTELVFLSSFYRCIRYGPATSSCNDNETFLIIIVNIIHYLIMQRLIFESIMLYTFVNVC